MNDPQGMTPDQAKMLGEVHGIVTMMRDQQKQQTEQLAGLDARLRDQENTAARHGAFAGSAMAIGVSLIVEGAKGWLKLKGGDGSS